MNRKLTAEECFAKAEAYMSCADHLDLEWTEDPLERKAGELLQRTLRGREGHWRRIGRQRMAPGIDATSRPPHDLETQ